MTSKANASARAELRATLPTSISLARRLATDEHPVLLYVQWLDWHTRHYWMLQDTLGTDEAEGFANAGGHHHVDAAKIALQADYLEELLERL